MTLSTSRQQFLAYESQTPEDIQYGRKGGLFITTCVCVCLVVLAVVCAGLVGIGVYYFAMCRVPNRAGEIWNEDEPFGSGLIKSEDLRLPSTILPSFYRLKLKTDLNNSVFSGNVAITLQANKKVKEIILHAKDLTIDNAKLTEQTYEQVHRRKRALKPVAEKQVDSENNVTANDSGIHITEVQKTHITEVFSTTTESPQVTESPKPDRTVTTDTVSTEVPKTVDSKLYHGSVKNIKIISVVHDHGERLVLTLASSLKPSVDYTLELMFKGNISDALLGFYKSSYINDNHEEKTLAVTQFEPTSARAAFPCFDEPQMKAKFEISIAHPKNLTALSNMRVAGQEDLIEDPSYTWTHFERSVSMSTYLVAFVISDFAYVETKYTGKDNISKPIRVWSRPELTRNANYALRITPLLLDYYEELFGVPFALDKLDLVAIPDFASTAMENWGLITFRETGLLYDETEGEPRDKQTVAISVAHELAHQWFGNLVTMRWWTDLWLNEGFATYIESVGVDKIEPAWKNFEWFARDKMGLFRTDALKNTSPVSSPVIDASEISQKFDEISYTKGANLIRMLNHTITGELFKQGLVNYLSHWKYSNAEENDLWDAMTNATQSSQKLRGVSVTEFMNSWTRQPGFPVVNVKRVYGSGEVTFTQTLFTASSNPYTEMAEQMWTIPISYTSVEDESWSSEPKIWLKDRSVTVQSNVSERVPMYVNVDAIGYYRVNYDEQNWESLREALFKGHIGSAIAKAQIIDDAFNLARVGHVNYSYALNLSTFVIDSDVEESRTVMEMLLTNMVFLKHNLRTSPGYVYFQDFAKLLVSSQLKLHNYGLDKPKDDNEAFLIENLMSWSCDMEDPRCLKWAKDQFETWAAQDDLTNNTIPTHLRSLVFSTSLRLGGRREFEILWNLFQNTTDPTLKSLIIEALPCTREEGLIAMLLEKSLTDLPKQYSDFVWMVEPPVGTMVAQQFFYDNWQRIYDKFIQVESMFSSVLTGVFNGIKTQEELDRLKEFAMSHKEELLPLSQTLQKLVDMADVKVHWVQRHSTTVEQWLKNYLNPNTTDASITTNETTIETISPSNTTEETIFTKAPVHLNSTAIDNSTIDQPTTENTTESPTNGTTPKITLSLNNTTNSEVVTPSLNTNATTVDINNNSSNETVTNAKNETTTESSELKT